MINAHNTTVNAVLIERCKVSVVLISTSSASVLFFFHVASVLTDPVIQNNRVVDRISDDRQRHRYKRIIDRNSEDSENKEHDQNIMNKRDHSCDSGCKTSQCRKAKPEYIPQ